MATPEYSPELDESVLQALRRKIQEEEAQRVGEAQGAATARGLSGSSFEAIRIGQANKAATGQLADAYTNIALERARMGREERLIGEERTFTAGQADIERKFAALENEKQRAFQSGETDKARQFQAAQDELARESESKAAMFGAAGNLVGSLGSSYITGKMLGGGFGAAGKAGAGGLFGGGGGGAAAAGGSPYGVGGFASRFAGGAAGSAAGIIGGGYAGQLLGKSLFNTNNRATARGTKVGSAVGAGIGTIFGPLGSVAGGALGGVVGGAVGKPVAKLASNVKKVFCFTAGTPILMLNGKTKPIDEVKLGDEAKGGKVVSVRVAETNDLFDYRGVYVTGEHAVLEDGKWLRVKNSRHAMRMSDIPRVIYSLVTEQHRLFIPNSQEVITFADEHETDYYEDLTIDESLALLNKIEEAA